MTKRSYHTARVNTAACVYSLNGQRHQIGVETMGKQTNLRNSFLPPFDNLLSADLELEGLVSVSG